MCVRFVFVYQGSWSREHVHVARVLTFYMLHEYGGFYGFSWHACNCASKLTRACRTTIQVEFLFGHSWFFRVCVAWSVFISLLVTSLLNVFVPVYAFHVHLGHEREILWRACGSELGLFLCVNGVVLISLSSFNRLFLSSDLDVTVAWFTMCHNFCNV